MNLKLPVCLAGIFLLLITSSIAGCANRRNSEAADRPPSEVIGSKSVAVLKQPHRPNTVPPGMISIARDLVPEFEIVEVEREVDGKEVTYNFEGTVRGREIELEIEEPPVQGR